MISEKLSIDLVALLALVALGFSRVLTPQEVFSGLSDTAVITILAIFILAHGLEVTGVAERLGDFLVRAARGNETRLIIAVMSAGAFMSMFMNNIAAASVLLPASATAARKAGVNLSHLLMPLGFGTLLGGMATLFATTNIVVSGVLEDNGLSGFGILDFAPLGVPLVLVGIAYMTLWGRHLLPAKALAERDEVIRRAKDDLLKIYQLGERLFWARIPTGSFLINRSLAESTFREKYGVNVVAVERNGVSTHLAPMPDFVFQRGDVLVLEGRLDEFRSRDTEPYLEILSPRNYSEYDLESTSIVVLEGVLTPRSSLLGRTLKETHFREKFGMTVLAVWNGERVIRTGLPERRLMFGDALLMQGPRSRLPVLHSDPDLILLNSEGESVRVVSSKGRIAVAIFALSVIAAAVAPFSIGVVMLAGALVMVIVNILTLEQAYRVIDWRIIFLVAGLLPLSVAMTKTGASELIANLMIGIVKPIGPLALLLALLMLTILLSQAMKGAAVSAVIAPIAIYASRQMGVDPRAMAMGVALATSMAFITPLGHPVNILMMGPGGYRFKDFFRVGLPLTAILLIVVMVALPVLWPLQ
jgi:di/tricarboxylate transporter